MTEETAPDDPAFRLRYAAVTDVGRHRKENQDSGYASEHLLVVADGVGGAAYGDVASSTAVHLLRRLDEAPTGDLLEALAGALHRIHDKLAEMVEQDDELDGTSTTVTAALFDGHRLGVAHAGDSRAYLLRDGHVEQVTTDHTFVQTLIDEGRITDDEARVHPHRNIILRAVDGLHETEPDLFHVNLQSGDRVMLCSDGCSGAVTDDEIGRILGEGSVDSAAVALVNAALEGGTTDNVTVVVAEVVPADAVDDPETNAAAATGPMLVGAAASQPRRGGMLSRALFRGRAEGAQRVSDTGELDPVPDEPVDPEELRYAPRVPRRSGGLRRVLLVLLPLLLIGAVLAGGYQWSQNQYYVATDGPQVAIFRGVQMELPGVDLSDVYLVDSLKVADLPTVYRDRVEGGIVADDLADAKRIVEDLAAEVPECPEPTPEPSPEPTDRPKDQPRDQPTTREQRQQTDRASQEPAPTRTASPTPSPTDVPADCEEAAP